MNGVFIKNSKNYQNYKNIKTQKYYCDVLRIIYVEIFVFDHFEIYLNYSVSCQKIQNTGPAIKKSTQIEVDG